MIVCSCNVFTDHDVRATLSGRDNVPAHDMAKSIIAWAAAPNAADARAPSAAS